MLRRRHKMLLFIGGLLTIGLFILLSTSPSYAEQHCGPQDYDGEKAPDFDCPSPGEADLVPDINHPPAVAKNTGDAVEMPWDGALVHRDHLVVIGLKLKAIRRLRWLDRRLTIQRREIDEEYWAEVSETNQQLCDARVEHYREVATAATERAASAQKWYRSWSFGLILGFVISGALIAAAAYVVTAI